MWLAVVITVVITVDMTSILRDAYTCLCYCIKVLRYVVHTLRVDMISILRVAYTCVFYCTKFLRYMVNTLLVT